MKAGVSTFEADPFIFQLVQCKNNVHDSFSLVLVVGWPPADDLEAPYRSFIEQIKQCFNLNDTANDVLGHASVYIYPFSCLHITVATLHSHILGTTNEATRRELTCHWRELICRASQRDRWPIKSLKIKIANAQLGSKAGILLWEEVSGGLQSIRHCIALEVQQYQQDSADNDVENRIDLSTYSIPEIVHSTFLRFHSVPQTDYEVVQERLRQKVLPNFFQVFSSEYDIDSVKLVCERKPYMHVPFDNKHVYECFTLQS